MSKCFLYAVKTKNSKYFDQLILKDTTNLNISMKLNTYTMNDQ